jgi:hypothetical protein
MSMIDPTTLIDKVTHSEMPRPWHSKLVCFQLIAMAQSGFDTDVLIRMQNAAFASAAQFVLHAEAKGLQVDDFHLERILTNYVGPSSASPLSADLLTEYMNSAKLHQQLGPRQLLVDAADLAAIELPGTSDACAARDAWLGATLRALGEHASGANASTPMFAAEQRRGIEQISRLVPAAMLELQVDDVTGDDDDDVSHHAPR